MLRSYLYKKYAPSLIYLTVVIAVSFDLATSVKGSPEHGNNKYSSNDFIAGRHSNKKSSSLSRWRSHRINHLYSSPSPDYANDMPDPQMLDPKDVAVLYQLQTVTQPPVKNDESGPYFEEQLNRNVVTRAGQTASLTCIVKNIRDRQVSWIRGRDLHVLSSGLIVFASDSRVSVTSSGSAWTLTISYSQPRDGGSYACQINTQPPNASWLNLTVIEAKANIEGPSTLYVQEGSNISLSCIIKEELVIPGLVLWYHGEALVPRDSKRIKVTTKVTNITTSHLNISGLRTEDSGNYSCWPSSGKQDTVLVHVIQGDPPAAMQHGNSSPSPCLQLRAFLTVITWLTQSLIIPGWLT